MAAGASTRRRSVWRVNGWHRPIELDRKRLDAVKKQIHEANMAWSKLYNLVKLAVGQTLLNDPLDPKAHAYYLGYRDDWLQRWHGFLQAGESLYADSQDVPYDGLWSIQRCFHYPSLRQAIESIRKYGGDEKIETATFIPAEDFWVQIAGRLRDLDRSLPSRRGEAGAWVKSRPDWIEAHPRTVLMFAILAVTIVVSVGFISARDLADLIRAIEGR